MIQKESDTHTKPCNYRVASILGRPRPARYLTDDTLTTMSSVIFPASNCRFVSLTFGSYNFKFYFLCPEHNFSACGRIAELPGTSTIPTLLILEMIDQNVKDLDAIINQSNKVVPGQVSTMVGTTR